MSRSLNPRPLPLTATGGIVPAITLVYDHDQIREAHRTLENGHVSGKLVLRP